MQSSFSCPFLAFFFSSAYSPVLFPHTATLQTDYPKKEIERGLKKTTVNPGGHQLPEAQTGLGNHKLFVSLLFLYGIFLQSHFKDQRGRNSLFPQPPLLYSDIFSLISHFRAEQMFVHGEGKGGSGDDESIRHLIKI